jgi:hypothetical protein
MPCKKNLADHALLAALEPLTIQSNGAYAVIVSIITCQRFTIIATPGA